MIMRINRVIAGACLIAVWQAGLAMPSAAADLGGAYLPPAPDMPPDAPMQFGPGWYLRGDASFGPEDSPALQGSGAHTSFSKNADQIGYGFGLGAGYKLNSFLRFDITADYLDPFKYSSLYNCGTGCSESFKTNVWRWDGLANAYVDLGEWAGLTPYVGAGVGFAGTHQDGSIGYDGGTFPLSFIDPKTGALITNGLLPSHTSYQLAWAGMIGVSYAFAPHAILDVGYRYLDLGRTTISLFPLATATKELTSQQVRIGLRYMID
jgi:opacity protein-like surface antigen